MSRMRHDEPGHAGDVRFGPGQEERERGATGARGPHLLPAHGPPALDARSSRAHAPEVRTGVGFGEELTPSLVPADDDREVGEPLLVRPVGEEDRREHFERHRSHLRRHAVVALHLDDHLVLPGRADRPPYSRGHERPAKPGLEEGALPATCHLEGHLLVVLELLDRRSGHDVRGREVTVTALLRRVILEPLLHLLTERRGRRRCHARLHAAAPRRGRTRSPGVASLARQQQVEARRRSASPSGCSVAPRAGLQ